MKHPRCTRQMVKRGLMTAQEALSWLRQQPIEIDRAADAQKVERAAFRAWLERRIAREGQS